MITWATVEATAKTAFDSVVGFLQMVWTTLILPYWWAWLIVVAVAIVMRLRRPSRRR